MDILDKIDLIVEEFQEKKIFDTFDEACEYSEKYFGQHKRILHYPSEKVILMCKCISKAHEKYGNITVYCHEDYNPFGD